MVQDTFSPPTYVVTRTSIFVKVALHIAVDMH
jgi:hypothetical protein